VEVRIRRMIAACIEKKKEGLQKPFRGKRKGHLVSLMHFAGGDWRRGLQGCYVEKKKRGGSGLYSSKGLVS